MTVTGAASGYPGTRGTPAVGEGKVCTLGVGGVLSCLDAATGKVVGVSSLAGIAVGTVMRAFEVLRREGLVRTVPGRGVWVLPQD